MPRSFSATARTAMLAVSTPEAFLALATISHAPTSDIFRVVMNTEPIVSRGQAFQPYAFHFQLPTESGEEVGTVQFDIDNTDLVLIDMLRRITEPANFLIEIVLASDPDVVELTLDDLVLREVTWDATKISGKLALDDVLNQRFPCHLYDPVQYAGLF